MPEKLFPVTTRTPHSSDQCMGCGHVSVMIYVFPLDTFHARLCRDCLGQLRVAIGEMLDGPDDTRTLHVAVDRDGWTWRMLQGEDGSRCMYYSMPGDPPDTKRIVWDTSDTWTDPPRVLRARAENAEVRMSEMQHRIADLVSALNDYGQHAQPCTGSPCICGLALAIKG